MLCLDAAFKAHLGLTISRRCRPEPDASKGAIGRLTWSNQGRGAAQIRPAALRLSETPPRLRTASGARLGLTRVRIESLARLLLMPPARAFQRMGHTERDLYPPARWTFPITATVGFPGRPSAFREGCSRSNEVRGRISCGLCGARRCEVLRQADVRCQATLSENRWRAACRDTPRATAIWFHDLP